MLERTLEEVLTKECGVTREMDLLTYRLSFL